MVRIDKGLTMSDVATRTRYRVEGMDCAACAAKIDTAVRRLPGVTDVSVSVSAATLVVHHDEAGVLADVERQVTRLGYGLAALGTVGPVEALADDGTDARAPPPAWWRGRKPTLVIACAAALAAAFVAGHVAPELGPWAFTAAMLVGLVPVARRALGAARAGTPFSIETLMVVAALGAVAIGAAEEAASVVLLFLIGEMLEGVAAGRARASIQSLADLVPRTAVVEVGPRLREMPAAKLMVGHVILVRPGDRIAADGVVLDGEGEVDEAPVSGESVPVTKSAGDIVFAGTVNGSAALRIRVTAAAADNTIARIVRLVEEAQESRAPTERMIDRFARWYTPSVMAVALLVAILPPLVAGGDWAGWIYKGLALLLIGCPCALVISTPAAIAAGLSAGARRGLLVKAGPKQQEYLSVRAQTLPEAQAFYPDFFKSGTSAHNFLAATLKQYPFITKIPGWELVVGDAFEGQRLRMARVEQMQKRASAGKSSKPAPAKTAGSDRIPNTPNPSASPKVSSPGASLRQKAEAALKGRGDRGALEAFMEAIV